MQILDVRMAAAQGFGQQVLSLLDSQIAEVEDMLSYCSDVLNTGAHVKIQPRFPMTKWQF